MGCRYKKMFAVVNFIFSRQKMYGYQEDSQCTKVMIKKCKAYKKLI